MEELIRRALEFRPMNVPVGKGAVLNASMSIANVLMLILQNQFGIPVYLSGILAAWLIKLDMVEDFVGREFSELVSLGAVAITTESLVGTNAMIRSFVSSFAPTLLPTTAGFGQLTEADRAIRTAPALPASVRGASELERQILAIRA